jgi:hypothetical protein
VDTSAGMPVQTNIRTSSAWGKNLSAAEADALTTAVMVMGLEKAKAFISGSEMKERGIEFMFLYENTAKNDKKTYEIVTNMHKKDVNVINTAYKLCGYLNGDGEFVYKTYRQNNLWIWITLGVTALAAAVFGVTYYYKTHYITVGKKTESTAQKLKRQKLFLKKDIIVYAAVAALAVVLFVAFVFIPNKTELTELHIYRQSVLIYAYDFKTKTGEVIAPDYKDNITVDESGGKIRIRVQVDGRYNIVEIDGKKAVVEDANCSRRKDCVHAFAPITGGNQAIVCHPHSLRIVGVGENENMILNG